MRRLTAKKWDGKKWRLVDHGNGRKKTTIYIALGSSLGKFYNLSLLQRGKINFKNEHFTLISLLYIFHVA